MSETWPWVAGAAVAMRFLLPIFVLVIVVALVVIGLLAHWF
jgi:hypothetical protein